MDGATLQTFINLAAAGTIVERGKTIVVDPVFAPLALLIFLLGGLLVVIRIHETRKLQKQVERYKHRRKGEPHPPEVILK